MKSFHFIIIAILLLFTVCSTLFIVTGEYANVKYYMFTLNVFWAVLTYKVCFQRK